MLGFIIDLNCLKCALDTISLCECSECRFFYESNTLLDIRNGLEEIGGDKWQQ